MAGYPYLALQYREAKTLTTALKAGLFTEAKDCIQFVSRCASALEQAHQKGVVHRDIKPDNLLVTNDKKPLIIDFGLARSELMRTNTTKTGVVLGTPAYMAPECIQGEKATPSADIYSLGVLLFEMIASANPFKGALVEIVDAKLRQAPPKLRAYCPRAEIALSHLIDGMLLPISKRKPSSCAQLVNELKDLSRAQAKDEAKTKVIQAPHKEKSKLKRNDVPWLCLIVLLVVLCLCSSLADKSQVQAPQHRLTLNNVSPERKLRELENKLLKRKTVPSPHEAREIGQLVIAAEKVGSFKDTKVPEAIGLEYGVRLYYREMNFLMAANCNAALINRHSHQFEPTFLLELCNIFRLSIVFGLPMEKRYYAQQAIIKKCLQIGKAQSSKTWQRVTLFCEALCRLDSPFEKRWYRNIMERLKARLDEDGNVVSKIRFNAIYVKFLVKNVSAEQLVQVEKIVDKFRPHFSKDVDGAFELLTAAAECFGKHTNEFSPKTISQQKSIEYSREAHKYAATKVKQFSIRLFESNFLRDASRTQESYSLLKKLSSKDVPQPLQLQYYLQLTRTCRHLGKFDEALAYLNKAEQIVRPEQHAFFKKNKTKLMTALQFNKGK